MPRRQSGPRKAGRKPVGMNDDSQGNRPGRQSHLGHFPVTISYDASGGDRR